MATRSIVTSQPDVACDMCGRRLLRGEHPDVFLADGERRTVCELCAPRATHEGWQRESESSALALRPSRRKRGVSLLGRLRQLRDTGGEREGPAESSAGAVAGWDEPGSAGEGLQDLLDTSPSRPARPFAAGRPIGDGAAGKAAHAARAGEPQLPRSSEGDAVPLGANGLELERALEVFNAGEQPRRVAGVARSLGAPSVTVRPVEGSQSRFSVVVAWELCWYRYEVDLEDEPAGAQPVGKGMELAELEEQDRLANAAADERGELRLLA